MQYSEITHTAYENLDGFRVYIFLIQLSCHSHNLNTILRWNGTILDRVLGVPSFCQFGNIVSVGLLFSASHPGPPFFFFFLFIQKTIVNSHSNKEEDTGDNEEDSAALVRVLVIMIDVLEPSCKDKITL